MRNKPDFYKTPEVRDVLRWLLLLSLKPSSHADGGHRDQLNENISGLCRPVFVPTGRNGGVLFPPTGPGAVMMPGSQSFSAFDVSINR